MEIDYETQEFLDLYVQGKETYTPPATEDIEGRQLIHAEMLLVREEENQLLNKLRNTRFS